RVSATSVARKSGTIAGLIAAERAFRVIDNSIALQCELPDGSPASAGSVLARIEGPARAILTAERVALNFVGHLSGIATATRALVDAVKGTRKRNIETRKTTSGISLLEILAGSYTGGITHHF